MAHCIGCEGEGAPGWPEGSSPETWGNATTGEGMCLRCAQAMVEAILNEGSAAPNEPLAVLSVLHRAQRAEWLLVAGRYDAKAAEARAKGTDRCRCGYYAGDSDRVERERE